MTAFHKDYKMSDPENTTPAMLMRAAEIGRRDGLRYVYAGNLPGRVGDLENTRCHDCRALLVERYGYFIQSYRLTARGRVRTVERRFLDGGAPRSTGRSRRRRSCRDAAPAESDVVHCKSL